MDIKNKFRKIKTKLKWGRKIGSLGMGTQIGKDVVFINPERIFIGENVSIGPNTFFGAIAKYMDNKYYDNKIIIGKNTIIGKNNSFAALKGIIIGNNVLFAGHVHITDHSHGYEDITMPIAPQKLISKGPVIIEDDCWLGFSCEILSGVHIGKHSIVAARAVVTKDVPPYSIVAGNPARIVKQYNFETKQWEKVRK